MHQYISNSLSLGHLSAFQYFVLIQIMTIRLRACWYGSWLKVLIPMQKNTSENKAAKNAIRQRLNCWLLHILNPNELSGHFIHCPFSKSGPRAV